MNELPIMRQDYATLWELAELMARESVESAERCWTRIMNAVLSGQLSSEGVVHFFPRGQGSGLDHEVVPRDKLDEILSEQIHDGALDELSGWSIAGYVRPEFAGPRLLQDEFVRRGLAIRREEFDRWRLVLKHSANLPASNAESPEPSAALPARRPVAPAELRKWYIARIGGWRGKPPTREDDVKAARQKFPDATVTRNPVWELRNKHAPEEWRRKGRPSGKRNT